MPTLLATNLLSSPQRHLRSAVPTHIRYGRPCGIGDPKCRIVISSGRTAGDLQRGDSVLFSRHFHEVVVDDDAVEDEAEEERSRRGGCGVRLLAVGLGSLTRLG